MTEISIDHVTEKSIGHLCQICVPSTRSSDPDYAKGIEEKKRWSEEMLRQWGAFAKLAYDGKEPVGFIQYRPVPGERIVWIDCIWVPRRRYWQKGIATRLLASMKEHVSRPSAWFNNQRPLAIVTRAFPGGGSDQYTSRRFYAGKGFKQVGKDPDLLYYPLEEGFVYGPPKKQAAGYAPHKDDEGKVLVVCGPNGCPVNYAYFLKRMERYVRELDPAVPIVWIDAGRESEKVRSRNIDVGACVVNGHLMTSFVLDKKGFQKEAGEALKGGSDTSGHRRQAT